MSYLALPFVVVKFWFLEAPLGLFKFFFSLNSAVLHFFSFEVLIRSFFKPLKNEYRKGLVGFSIGMGIFVKTFLILTSIIVVGGLFIAEVFLVILFVLFPIITFALFLL